MNLKESYLLTAEPAPTINCHNKEGGAGCVAGEHEGGAAPCVIINY